jgi:hypothetical protein
LDGLVAAAADTADIRVRGMLGVFAADRIFNAKTAHSQLIIFDRRLGQFIDNGLYHVPVNADVPDIQAVTLDEVDQKAIPHQEAFYWAQLSGLNRRFPGGGRISPVGPNFPPHKRIKDMLPRPQPRP